MLEYLIALVLIVLSSSLLSSLYLKTKIENKYIILSLIVSALYFMYRLYFNKDLGLKEYLILMILNTLAIMDFKIRIVPDTLVISLIIIMVITKWEFILNSLISGLALFIVFYLLAYLMEKIMKQEALGGGDIKLMFPLGMSLGFITGYLAIVIASVLGLIYYFLRHEKDYIPFVPFIALAWLIFI